MEWCDSTRQRILRCHIKRGVRVKRRTAGVRRGVEEGFQLLQMLAAWACKNLLRGSFFLLWQRCAFSLAVPKF